MPCTLALSREPRRSIGRTPVQVVNVIARVVNFVVPVIVNLVVPVAGLVIPVVDFVIRVPVIPVVVVDIGVPVAPVVITVGRTVGRADGIANVRITIIGVA